MERGVDHVHACGYVRTAHDRPESCTATDSLEACRVKGRRGGETRQLASVQGPGCHPGGSPLSSQVEQCPLSSGSGSPSRQVIPHPFLGGTWG